MCSSLQARRLVFCCCGVALMPVAAQQPPKGYKPHRHCQRTGQQQGQTRKKCDPMAAREKKVSPGGLDRAKGPVSSEQERLLTVDTTHQELPCWIWIDNCGRLAVTVLSSHSSKSSGACLKGGGRGGDSRGLCPTSFLGYTIFSGSRGTLPHHHIMCICICLYSVQSIDLVSIQLIAASLLIWVPRYIHFPSASEGEACIFQ